MDTRVRTDRDYDDSNNESDGLPRGHQEITEDSLALFVSGSPAGISAALLQQLAAEADFILAVDSGANQLLAAGIAPDLLIGDFDSIDPAVMEHYQAEQVAMESFDAYKNATDVELGIEALYERGFRRMIATNVLGGRSDHALGSLGALAGAAAELAMEVVLRDEHELCYFLSSADSERVLELSLEKQLAQPKHISLISWGGSNTVSLTGTEWELDHYCLSPYSARGVSNLARNSQIRLVVHNGAGTVIMLLTI